MNEGGRAFGGLDEVGKDGVSEQGHHGAGGVEVGGADGVAVAGCADDDGGEAAAQVGAVLGEGEDGHDLRGRSDDEAGVAIGAVALAVDFDADPAQRAIVHIHGARPPDVGGIEVEGVAVEEVGVDECGEKVVRRGDGVKVAGEVEIDLLAGLDLREAATGRAALHAEDGAEGGFAGSDDGLFAEVLESLDEADGGDSLAFAGSCGGGGGDEDQLAARRTSGVAEKVEVQLGKLGAELVVVVVAQAQLAGDGSNGQQRQFGGGSFDGFDHRTFFSGRGERCCDGPHVRCRPGGVNLSPIF